MPVSTFLSGKDAVMRYFQDDNEVATLNVKSWEFGPKVTEFQDGVNGEQRDRVGSQTDSYEINLELYVDTLEQIDVLIKDRDNEDARAVPLNKSALMQLFPRGAGQKAYAFTDLAVGAWRVKHSGRKERLTVSLPLQAGDMKKIPNL
jgi:hypothetical protein